MATSVSAVEIANMALAHLGQNPIESFTENTVAARTCNRWYDRTRREMLRLHPWRFATKYVALSQLVGTPTETQYSAIYALPTDMVKLLYVTNNNQEYEWEVIGETVHTSIVNPCIKYVWDLEDPTKFDDTFVDAFSYKLASRMAMVIVGSSTIRTEMLQGFVSCMRTAQAENANEARTDPAIPTSLVSARRGGVAR